MSTRFPEKVEGALFFKEILPWFVSEYDPSKLAMLGLIIGKKGKAEMYESLRYSLRKIQWVKLSGLKAIHIEEELMKAVEPNSFVLDPLRQTAHTLCITDCLIHTKSAVDSMAVFLTDLLELPQKKGERDFKKPEFRQSIYQKDVFLKHSIKKLEPWLIELQAVRDDWIHIKTLESLSVQGKSGEVGMLPIPKKIDANIWEQRKMPLNSQNFWSTKDFVTHHYSKVTELFRDIVDRSLQIESLDLKEPITLPEDYIRQLSFFPMYSNENMTLQKIRFYNPTSMTDW